MDEIHELKQRLVDLKEVERQNMAVRWKRAEELWKQPSMTAAQIADLTGFSRGGLYKRLGPRGTRRAAAVGMARISRLNHQSS